MADELIAAALPTSIARHVIPDNTCRPSSLSGSAKGEKDNPSMGSSRSYGQQNDTHRQSRGRRHSGNTRSDRSTGPPNTFNSFDMLGPMGGAVNSRRRGSASFDGLSADSANSNMPGPSALAFQPLVGPWAFPNRKRLNSLTKRYRSRLPPPVHPCRTVRMFHSTAMVQRKFCTVLVAHFLKDSHLRAPRWVMETMLDELALCVAQHRVEIIPTTGASAETA
jgi:hypothetical protein